MNYDELKARAEAALELPCTCDLNCVWLGELATGVLALIAENERLRKGHENIVRLRTIGKVGFADALHIAEAALQKLPRFAEEHNDGFAAVDCPIVDMGDGSGSRETRTQIDPALQEVQP